MLGESTPVILLCTFIAMMSGVALSASEELLDVFPVILVMLPALNSMIGDACQVLVSRLSTHLYLGIIPPRFVMSFRVREDLSGLLIHLGLSLAVLVALGFITSALIGIALSHVFYIIFVFVIATFSIFLVMFLVLFAGATWLFKHGKDPSNFLVPLTTSTIDMLSPVMIVLMMLWLV